MNFQIQKQAVQLTRPRDYELTKLEDFREITENDLNEIYSIFSEVIEEIKYDSFYYFLKILNSNKNLAEIDFRNENPQIENDSYGTCVDLGIELKNRLRGLGYNANLTNMVDIFKSSGDFSRHLAVSVPLIFNQEKGWLILDERTGVFWITESGRSEIKYEFFSESQTSEVSQNAQRESHLITTKKINRKGDEDVKVSEFFPEQDYLYPQNFLMKKILPNTKYLIYRTRDVEGENKSYCMLDLRKKPYNFRFCTSQTGGTIKINFIKGEKIEDILNQEELLTLSQELGMSTEAFSSNVNMILSNISKLEEFWQKNK